MAFFFGLLMQSGYQSQAGDSRLLPLLLLLGVIASPEATGRGIW